MTLDLDGNEVRTAVLVDTDRYHFDYGECDPTLGWLQWDTRLDGRDFGIWVHLQRCTIVVFAHGLVTRLQCPDDARFGMRLAQMEVVYGPPPIIAVDRDDQGVVETYFGSRVHPSYIARLLHSARGRSPRGTRAPAARARAALESTAALS